MRITRRETRKIHIGNVAVGGDSPIVVQSMCSTDTRDVHATLQQISRLAEVGCEIIRLAVLDDKAVEALKVIKKEAQIPLIADIHFDHRLALGALRAGVDGLRINPGNIGGEKAVARVGLWIRTYISATAVLRQRPWWKVLFARYNYWNLFNFMRSKSH